jgi:hypothetical protein
MSRRISVNPLTVFASLAAVGIGLAPVGASAASLAVHITPSLGHPVWLDLRDQTRYPKIQSPMLTDDSGTVFHGHPTVHVPAKPGHPKPNHRN